MFHRHKKSGEGFILQTPPGITELVICVFDEKHRVCHFMNSASDDAPEQERFQLLNAQDHAMDNGVIREAIESESTVSFSILYGQGMQKFVSVLPYQYKKNKMRFICMQVGVERLDPDKAVPDYVRALVEGRVCMFLADTNNAIRAVGARVPKVFGYSSSQMAELNLSNLFASSDMGIINAWKEDDHHGELSCVLLCKDGSRRDVEIKKYPLPDGNTLYGVFDITSSQFSEEASQISMRERRRIGQDLHDSIGQLLTGISLLSRSLANNLQREKLPGDMDAIQISELADDASNQIRQISRGLMPTDIVMRGLFASLKDLARVTTECCGLICEATIDETIAFSDGAVETHLFRIAQEAVNNAVRHANAERIDILLTKKNDGPCLVIRDDGHWRNIMENSGGIGMKTMHYRAVAINGHLHIGKSETGGTEVICRLEMDELLEPKA